MIACKSQKMLRPINHTRWQQQRTPCLLEPTEDFWNTLSTWNTCNLKIWYLEHIISSSSSLSRSGASQHLVPAKRKYLCQSVVLPLVQNNYRGHNTTLVQISKHLATQYYGIKLCSCFSCQQVKKHKLISIISHLTLFSI